jgi:hypothetical protein
MYYFVSTALLTSFAASKALSLTISTGLPQQLGLVMGLFAGSLGGYFNRTTSIEVSAPNSKTFFKTVEEALEKMGYSKLREEEDGVVVYQRGALAKLISGRVFVQVEQGSAIVASRAIHIRRLRQLLDA